jgi:hypothetical protein
MRDKTASTLFVLDESAVAAGAQDGHEDGLGYNLRPVVWKEEMLLLILGCGGHGEFRAHDWPVLST